MSNNMEFQTEIAAMSLIENERLVCSLGGSLKRPNLFILLPFFEQGSLFDMLHPELKEPSFVPHPNAFETSEGLPYHYLMTISHDVSLGVKYLHSHFLLHRDLKTANILINQFGRASITDFGIIKCAPKNYRFTKGAGTPR